LHTLSHTPPPDDVEGGEEDDDDNDDDDDVDDVVAAAAADDPLASTSNLRSSFPPPVDVTDIRFTNLGKSLYTTVFALVHVAANCSTKISALDFISPSLRENWRSTLLCDLNTEGCE